MSIRATLAAALLAIPQTVAAQTAPVRLSYAATVGAFDLMSLQASVAIAPQSYRVELSYHLTGFIGALFHAESTTTVDGRFQGAAAVPRELFSTGHMRGEPRATQIDWRNGNPTVTQLIPPIEPEREPVPPADQAHTVDALSAMAGLLHQVEATGRCDGAASIYDGRRLSNLVARTVGEEVLEPRGGSSFRGPALRCDFEGHQLGGFWRDTDPAAVRQPQRGSAWFASLAPGQAPVPVRITFDLRRYGLATMYLVGQSEPARGNG